MAFINGGSGNDVVSTVGSNNGLPNATNDADTILGHAANDNLNGGGNDAIDGGTGNDFICGEGGDDSLFGGSGNDTLNGGAGIDFLEGGFGSDSLTGGFDADVFYIAPYWNGGFDFRLVHHRRARRDRRLQRRGRRPHRAE
jgi:Ca2+-binding RTX toxin-like protein